ncbi:MAG TPA: OmpA family protein, partial [Cytophagaceae bacterium]|nr:OmpA family protein [Cytophagaceae bacterium]
RLIVNVVLLIPTIVFSQSIPIGQPINTGNSDEYNPCISGNGRTLIFEQLYFNESKPQVLISYQKSGVWTRPEVLPGANTDIPTIANGGFFLNQNGNVVLFHSARYGGVGNNDIWMIEKTIIGTWSAPKNLGKPINSPLQETDPSLSPDGKYLYFTRLTTGKTPDGNPCGKIFVAERAGKDSWKTPVELPAPINLGCECAGRLLSDNKTFLFASMRTGGMGGYDLYKTVQRPDHTWEEPIPYSFLNTSKDDLYVSVPAAGGLVYHTAPAKTGGLDVTRTKIPDELQPEKVTLIQGNLKNAVNNLAITPKVTVTNTTDGKSNTFIGGADGSYTAVIPQDNLYDVAIMANDGGYSFKSMLFKAPSPTKYEEKTMDIKLIPTKTDAVFTLNNLAFINNSDTLENYSTADINRLYFMLKANITMRIEIGVHTYNVEQDTVFRNGLSGKLIDSLGTYTDSSGHEMYKLKITYTSDNTKNQAKAIAAILIKRGIPVERVLPKGYGESVPLSPPPTDKALNRRVELKVIHE